MNKSMIKMIQKNPHVCATTLDGELVVMSNQDNIYYKINASGIKIWDFLDTQACSLEAIVEFIAQYYQVPLEIAQTDVETFIAMMLKKNIVQYVS